MRKKMKKLMILATSLTFLLTAFAACQSPNNSSGSSPSGDSSGSPSGGQPGDSVFAIENNRVELDTEDDLDLLYPFNDFGTGEPTISLDTSIKKFGEASIKVENPANRLFTSDNSWPSVELAFENAQDFSKKRFTQIHIYSAETEPFVMNVQYVEYEKFTYYDNMRQINPGWNVIEITNGKSRDMRVPANFGNIGAFVFSVWGHAEKDCTYYIDDIVLSDRTAQTGDIYEFISLEQTSWAETKGSNYMQPYTLLRDGSAQKPSTLELLDNGELLVTQNTDWHFLLCSGFNNAISQYSVFSADFENVSDTNIDVGIAVQGGDYRDKGPRIAPSGALERKVLRPGERATITLSVAKIEKALQDKSSELTLDNLSVFHIFSTEEKPKQFIVSNICLLTERGIEIKASERVSKMIAALPALNEITIDSKAKIEGARAAYDALTEAQQAAVENYATLQAAEERFASFGDEVYAARVDNMIAELPALDSLTLDNQGDVEAVIAAYDALTETQQGLVANYAALQAAEAKIFALLRAENAFYLIENRVEIDTQADLALLETANTYGDGTVKPVVSLDTQVKKFGDASVKVVNPANSAFTSANSESTVKVKFDEVQNFTTKKFTQVWVYSAEDCPFVMDVRFTVGADVVSNKRQINPGWNVIEITNGIRRTFAAAKDFRKIASFTFTVWGHKTETCTYYIDDIVLSDESAQASIAAASDEGDVYEIISFAKTKYWEGESEQNLMLPYTMLFDDNTAAGKKTARTLNENGGLLCTPESAGRWVDFNGFNNVVDGYSRVEVEIENPNDAAIRMSLYFRHYVESGNKGSDPPYSYRQQNVSIAAGATGVLTLNLTNGAFNAYTGVDISNLIMMNVNDVDGLPYVIKSIKLVK